MSVTVTPEELAILKAQIEIGMQNDGVDWNPKPIADGKTVQDYSPIISITPSSVGSSADISALMPPLGHQQSTNACVSVSICNAVQYYFSSRNITPLVPPSYLFVYYNARVLWHGLPLRNTECTTGDCGCTVRHNITAINTYGICSNGLWPWNPARVLELPDIIAYNDGLNYNQVFTFIKLVYDLDVLRCVLYFLKVPIMFGFIIYDSFNSDFTRTTGHINTPTPSDTCLGQPVPPGQTCTMGHCVLLTGYDDTTLLFQFQNSYGNTWGTQSFRPGFGTMGYDYVMNPALAQWDDIWIVGPSRVLKI